MCVFVYIYSYTDATHIHTCVRVQRERERPAEVQCQSWRRGPPFANQEAGRFQYQVLLSGKSPTVSSTKKQR